MKKLLLPAIILVFSFQMRGYCQSDSAVLKNALLKLKSAVVDHISEKAYLHLDRQYPFYVAGEVVYFKAYVTMDDLHEPTNISGALHVDLVDKNNEFIKTLLVKLDNGVGWGDFTLPDTLQKGAYRIRAYTEWMRNDAHPNFFDQYISVSSVNNTEKVAEAATRGAQPDLQFFPEGGSLVVDVPAIVAFKAVGSDGLGINVKGVVVDDQKHEVAKIASTHLGMGVFYYIPEADRRYKATVTFANGSQRTIDLPSADTKGITLSVNYSDPAKLAVQIRANRAYYKENENADLNILMYWAGSVRTIKTKLSAEILGLNLPATDLRTGVLQITVLSATGEPLNERMVFVQNPDQLKLSVDANKQSFAKRENVQLKINAQNKDGKAVNGSFSVSVIDQSKILVEENSENSILAYLLLTSDLKGYVEKPNYYFAHITKDTRADLDALMLTQGYRRFVWKQLLKGELTAKGSYSPEKLINVSGVLTTKAGNLMANSKITLIEKSTGLVLKQETDANGKFVFTDLDVSSTSKFILKTESSSGKNAAVLVLDKPKAGPPFDPSTPMEVRYNPNADILASAQYNTGQGILTASDGSTVTMTLEKSESTNTRKEDSYRSTKLGGAGGADQVIKADQIASGPRLSEDLKGVVRGIDFSQMGEPYLINSAKMGQSGTEPMLVLVDGAPGPNIDNINPGDVESIEILKGPSASIYGVRASSGVFYINTRQTAGHASISKEMSPGIFSVNPAGFYKAREFYSQVYDGSQAENNMPDTRTTVCWKPDVKTDADGNASFNFYNADGVATYRVVVEGMDTKGNLGRQVFTYKVK